MSILSSASRAITGVLDTVGDVAKTAQQTIGMASTYVDHKSQAWEMTVYESTLADTAKVLRTIQADLAEDAELAKIHSDLAAKWRRPPVR